ncbi:ATP-binding cassette domain-containing protein [Candidatus Dependentiae bacterium]|nr:ATP-binding cassette domain-containing protein [Candidatus Dependentiae bacterium]
MIQLQNLCLTFGGQKIFKNISYIINGHEKIALVGLNGSGKSTLLKIIAQQQKCDDGNVRLASNQKLGYMPQEVVLQSTKTVVEEVISAVEIFDETEIESTRAEVKKMLMGLGFSIEQMEQSVSELSVGWRMRIVLAQLLLKKADFYLFDEPTNHLDIVTKEWFLSFLKRAPFGFLLVCHEQYFLDKVCTSVLELEQGNGTAYKGNYSSYLRQKAERLAIMKAAYVQQQKEITHKQEIINKFKAGTRAKSAQSMQKSLEKIERIEIPFELKKVDFKLPPITPSGRTVLTVNNVLHAFDSKKIFNNISLNIERNEKVALIAANGVGKTTLLNVIMGKYPLQGGDIIFGNSVTSAFFEQDQVRALNPEKTVFETVQAAASHVTDLAIRNMLGCFLFSKDLIYKKTKVLSGGERNRLSMARALLQQSNFLILDEPTNHLDMPSKEILLDALKQYQGTILFVSHDQGFINELATHIIELTPTNAYKYIGNYDEYLHQKEFAAQKNESLEESSIKENKSPKNDFERHKEIRRLENQIEKIDTEINNLSMELSDYDYGTKEFSTCYERVEALQKKHKLLLAEWEKIQK